MMNVAAPATAPLPNHFAPPARAPSTRRQMYHHPTLHMRTGSSPRHSSSEVASPQPSPGFSFHSQPAPSQSQHLLPATSARPLQLTTSTHPQQQSQQRSSLQRQPTTGSNNSLTHYTHSGPHPLGHRRQTASTSTSNSSITRNPSGHSHYLPSTPPMLQVRPAQSPQDSYVSRLRRAKATVWSARGQTEDLDRSNSKEDKRKYSKRGQKAKLVSGGSASMYTHEQIGFSNHPRQLMPRLSANEAEDSDYMDPFVSGPNFFDTVNTAPSTKGSIKTKTTTSSNSPKASAENLSLMATQPEAESKSSESVEDGRGSPDPIQSYYKPPNRRQSKRLSRIGDDEVNDRQVGGERRLFVVNASPSESEEE